MRPREIQERRSSFWITKTEPGKHPKIDQHFTFFSYLNCAITAPNLFLLLVLLMSLIAPSCADDKLQMDDDIQALFRFGENVTKTEIGSQCSTICKVCARCSDPSFGSSPSPAKPAPPPTRESMISMEPPPPPSDTISGYNIWLDKPRPSTIEEYLRHFEVVFVVDDSTSMIGERWRKTRDALAGIAERTYKLGVDTVSLRFLNNPTHVLGLKGKDKLMSSFNKVVPKDKTPLGQKLKQVFNEHLKRIDDAVQEGQEKYSKIRPLDIIVLTDGMPTDKKEDMPDKVVANAVKQLKDKNYHPNTMYIQIVLIANEKEAKTAEKLFKRLVTEDKGRIFDTVRYKDVVDSKKLESILLRGVHPNIRSQVSNDTLLKSLEY